MDPTVFITLIIIIIFITITITTNSNIIVIIISIRKRTIRTYICTRIPANMVIITNRRLTLRIIAILIKTITLLSKITITKKKYTNTTPTKNNNNASNNTNKHTKNNQNQKHKQIAAILTRRTPKMRTVAFLRN